MGCARTCVECVTSYNRPHLHIHTHTHTSTHTHTFTHTHTRTNITLYILLLLSHSLFPWHPTLIGFLVDFIHKNIDTHTHIDKLIVGASQKNSMSRASRSPGVASAASAALSREEKCRALANAMQHCLAQVAEQPSLKIGLRLICKDWQWRLGCVLQVAQSKGGVGGPMTLETIRCFEALVQNVRLIHAASPPLRSRARSSKLQQEVTQLQAPPHQGPTKRKKQKTTTKTKKTKKTKKTTQKTTKKTKEQARTTLSSSSRDTWVGTGDWGTRPQTWFTTASTGPSSPLAYCHRMAGTWLTRVLPVILKIPPLTPPAANTNLGWWLYELEDLCSASLRHLTIHNPNKSGAQGAAKKPRGARRGKGSAFAMEPTKQLSSIGRIVMLAPVWLHAWSEEQIQIQQHQQRQSRQRGCVNRDTQTFAHQQLVSEPLFPPVVLLKRHFAPRLAFLQHHGITDRTAMRVWATAFRLLRRWGRSLAGPEIARVFTQLPPLLAQQQLMLQTLLAWLHAFTIPKNSALTHNSAIGNDVSQNIDHAIAVLEYEVYARLVGK